MGAIASWWLPILVSAVGCFVMSSLIWMAFKWHMKDWRKLPDEAAFLDAVRKQNLTHGWYVYPHCEFSDLKTPEGKARYEKGPWGAITVMPGMHAMGRSLGIWFVHLILVCVVAAWVVSTARGPTTGVSTIAWLAAVVMFVAAAGHELPGMAWKAQRADITARNLLDAVIYAAITGAVFGWLAPDWIAV